MKKVIATVSFLCLAFAPVSFAYLDNINDQDQQQQQGQIGINKQGQIGINEQDQDQKQKQQQGQFQAAYAHQGQFQGNENDNRNKNYNEGNQGQAEVNISQEYEDQLQFPTHVSLAAPYGTETAQMSIGGLTLSDTAPHVVAQAKMQVVTAALEGGLITRDEALAEVKGMLDDLEVQTRPKRIFSYGPKTSGKHLFNLFGIIATDSWRGNSDKVEPVEDAA